MTNDEMHLIDALFDKIHRFSETEVDRRYKYVSMGLNVVVMGFYIIRLYQVKGLKHSGRLRCFITGIMLVSGWSIVLNMFMDRLVICLPDVYSHYRELKVEGSDMLRQLSSHQFDNTLVMKDFQHFLIMAESLVIFKVFSVGVKKAVDYVRTNEPFDKESARDAVHVIAAYDSDSSDDIEYRQEYRGSWKMFSNRIFKDAINYSIKLLIITAILICILPTNLLLNSSVFIYQSDAISFKSDHLVWGLNVLFLIDNFHRISQVISGASQTSIRPLFVIIMFCWVYNCLVLVSVNTLFMLFHDIQINQLFVMVNTLLDNTHFDEYNINLFTSMLMSYFTHSSDNSCLHKICTSAETVDIMAEGFIYFNNLFTNCLIVLNLSCLVVIPFFIWVTLMEMRVIKIV